MKTVLRFAFALVILAFVAGTHAEDKAKEKWVSLFDGKTMKGWEKVGNKKSVLLRFSRRFLRFFLVPTSAPNCSL